LPARGRQGRKVFGMVGTSRVRASDGWKRGETGRAVLTEDRIARPKLLTGSITARAVPGLEVVIPLGR